MEETKRLDDKSRSMLAYLNINTKLSSATLAEAFNQHYKVELDDAMETLYFLANKSMVKIKTKNDELAIMIQVTHIGRTYEQELHIQDKEIKNKCRNDKFWTIITLILSSLLSIIVNLIMKWGFGI